MGSGAANQLIADRLADAVITRPVLRSEVETLLARIADGETDLSAPSASGGRGAAVARFQVFRVLVADDNAVNREVATEALSRLGGTVEVVVNGVEAVEAVAKSD